MIHLQQQPTGRIFIDRLRLYAHHGVEAQETKVGNNFEVSVSLVFDCEHAMRTDRLDLTVSYAEVIDIIKEEMAFPSKLLENVVFRIYDHLIRRYPNLQGGSITLSKLQPPVTADLASAGFAFEW